MRISECFRMRMIAARKIRGMTQYELAAVSGVTSQCIQGIEQGRRSPLLDTAVRICFALNTSIDEMIED